jgi:hypothetical protein
MFCILSVLERRNLIESLHHWTSNGYHFYEKCLIFWFKFRHATHFLPINNRSWHSSTKSTSNPGFTNHWTSNGLLSQSSYRFSHFLILYVIAILLAMLFSLTLCSQGRIAWRTRVTTCHHFQTRDRQWHFLRPSYSPLNGRFRVSHYGL